MPLPPNWCSESGAPSTSRISSLYRVPVLPPKLSLPQSSCDRGALSRRSLPANIALHLSIAAMRLRQCLPHVPRIVSAAEVWAVGGRPGYRGTADGTSGLLASMHRRPRHRAATGPLSWQEAVVVSRNIADRTATDYRRPGPSNSSARIRSQRASVRLAGSTSSSVRRAATHRSY